MVKGRGETPPIDPRKKEEVWTGVKELSKKFEKKESGQKNIEQQLKVKELISKYEKEDDNKEKKIDRRAAKEREWTQKLKIEKRRKEIVTESFLDKNKQKFHIQLTNREDHEEAPGHLTNVGKGVEDSEKEEVVVFAFGKNSKLKNKTWKEIKEGRKQKGSKI